jgi:hypothetical protein
MFDKLLGKDSVSKHLETKEKTLLNASARNMNTGQ